MGRRAQRTTAEPHGTPRNIKKARLRTQIHFFFARFPYFRLLVFFSPLLPSPTPAVATNGRPFETTDMLRARRWGKRPRMEECRRNVLASGPDIGATGTTDNRGTPRNPTEPHGAPRNIKKGRLRPQIHLFFALLPHFRPLVFFSSLLSALSRHLLSRQMEGLSKPPTC